MARSNASPCPYTVRLAGLCAVILLRLKHLEKG
jgi:hypothetical protein